MENMKPGAVMIRDRKLNRLTDFDYTRNAFYFVTDCVKDRICIFGEISNHSMFLNAYGKIAQQQLLWLEQQYSFVRLHDSVIMPNHMYAIIEIDHHSNHLKNGHKIKSLSELMGAYKTTSSKQIHMAGHAEFKWQRSYYDHIIRNHASFTRISDYIKINPAKWNRDRFHRG
jgi:REP element-mobilizing transposase RayT